MKLTENELFDDHLASRMKNIPKSFIREMLKTAARKDVISFAGGLPDEKLIPVAHLHTSFDRAVQTHGAKLFQYANSEGYEPLRQLIADRYKAKYGMNLNANNILITNGSQQAFDLIGKVFLNKGDKVVLEQPGYLGIMQSLLCYEPKLIGVNVHSEGINIEQLTQTLIADDVKLMHIVPNFQNPSGISYSKENRNALASLVLSKRMYLIEDDPYGELFFSDNKRQDPIKKTIGDQGILLGSFSKTLSPGMRLGWVVASEEIISKLLVAKQAGDLHTNNISQVMTYEYLQNHNYEKHLQVIRDCYEERKNLMIKSLRANLSSSIHFNSPGGGMFIWLTLPEHVSSYKLLQLTMEANVVFVPGEMFFLGNQPLNTLRLNFSKSEKKEIAQGIDIIGKSLAYLITKNIGNIKKLL